MSQRDTPGVTAGTRVEPTCCDRCFLPLDPEQAGAVDLVTKPGVWCQACQETAT